MAPRKRLSFTNTAHRDLGRIYQHISEDSVQKATNQVRRIIHAADMLRDFPLMGYDRSRLDTDLRSINENPYVIFYYTEESRIVIARVLHQRQDIEAELLRFLEVNLESPSDPQ